MICNSKRKRHCPFFTGVLFGGEMCTLEHLAENDKSFCEKYGHVHPEVDGYEYDPRFAQYACKLKEEDIEKIKKYYYNIH